MACLRVGQLNHVTTPPPCFISIDSSLNFAAKPQLWVGHLMYDQVGSISTKYSDVIKRVIFAGKSSVILMNVHLGELFLSINCIYLVIIAINGSPHTASEWGNLTTLPLPANEHACANLWGGHRKGYRSTIYQECITLVSDPVHKKSPVVPLIEISRAPWVGHLALVYKTPKSPITCHHAVAPLQGWLAFSLAWSSRIS